MRWLEAAGFQFSFDFIAPGPVDPAAHLYSSHASLKLRALRDAGGFDGERFPFLMEDTELGIRLRRRGLRLDYRPELLVRHHHPQTLDGYARRMEVIGAAARRLRELYPGEAPRADHRARRQGPAVRAGGDRGPRPARGGRSAGGCASVPGERSSWRPTCAAGAATENRRIARAALSYWRSHGRRHRHDQRPRSTSSASCPTSS